MSEDTAVGRITFAPSDPNRPGQGNAGMNHGAAQPGLGTTLTVASGGIAPSDPVVVSRAELEALRALVTKATQLERQDGPMGVRITLPVEWFHKADALRDNWGV